MADNPKPRFKSALGADFGAYAEYGIQLAEESLAEAKRHNAIVERLLEEIRDRTNTTTITIPPPDPKLPVTILPTQYRVTTESRP